MTTPDAGSEEPLLGTGNIQKSIDQLAKVVDRLEGLIEKAQQYAGSDQEAPEAPPDNTQAAASTVTPRVRTISGAKVPAGPGNIGGIPRTIVGGALGAVATLASYGSSQMGSRRALNTYVGQQLMTTGPGGSPNQIRNQAVGGSMGKASGNMNALAFGMSDALQGQAAINTVTGIGGYNLPSYSRGRQASAQGFATEYGVANPGQGYAQAGQAAAQMMSPSTSMNMLMMGVQKTPLTMGGGSNPADLVNTSVLSRIHKGGSASWDPKALATTFSEGGIGNMDLQAMLGPGGDVAGYEKELEAQNMADRKYGDTKANTLFSQAKQGNQGAQDQLQKAGIPRTSIQDIKTLDATKTARTSDTAQSFDAGLQMMTDGLTSFNKALNDMANTAIGKAVLGYGGGAAGGFKSLTDPGHLLGSATSGAAMFSGMKVAKAVTGAIFGGGGTGDATASAGASASAGGAGTAVADATEGLMAFSKGGTVHPPGWQPANMPGGDSGQWKALWSDVQHSGVHGLSLTSDFRPGGQSAHAYGDAVDVAGTEPNMNKIFHWIVAKFPKSFELIHATEGSQCLKEGKRVPPSFWGAATWNEHFNHVHWALNYPGYYGGDPGKPGAGTPGGGSGSSPATTAAATPAPVNATAGEAGSGGLGLDPGTYGSSSELANLQSALLGGITSGSGTAAAATTPAAAAAAATPASTKPSAPGKGGPVGNVGPGIAAWAKAVLKGIGAPVNANNMAIMERWQVAEGGSTNNSNKYNYLNTGQTEPGSHGSPFPSYTSNASGAQAVVTTLENGFYSAILKALRSGKATTSSIRGTINSSQWGTHDFATGARHVPLGEHWVGERGPELEESDVPAPALPPASVPDPPAGEPCRTIDCGDITISAGTGEQMVSDVLTIVRARVKAGAR